MLGAIDKEMPFGNIYKDDGTPLKGSDDIDKNRNANNWKSLRSTMLAGKRHRACKLCWDEEDNDMESKRQQHNIINKSYLKFKVLGNGKLTSKIDIEVDYSSISAKEKIEKAGGKISIIKK